MCRGQRVTLAMRIAKHSYLETHPPKYDGIALDNAHESVGDVLEAHNCAGVTQRNQPHLHADIALHKPDRAQPWCFEKNLHDPCLWHAYLFLWHEQ